MSSKDEEKIQESENSIEILNQSDLLMKKKRKRSSDESDESDESGESEIKNSDLHEQKNSIVINDAFNLTEEEKLKCKFVKLY
jgi:hypothetical protein